VLQSVSLLASDETEEPLPLPAPLAEGRVDAVRTGRGLGIINTAFASGEERFADVRWRRTTFSLLDEKNRTTMLG